MLLRSLALFSLSEDVGQPVRMFSTDAMFTVRTFYRHLTNRERAEGNFLYRQIWKVNAPPRIAFFTWEAVHGCILTIDTLMKRGRILVYWCCLCKRTEETCNHSLLRCPIAYSLWSMAFGILGYSWVFGWFC